MRRQAIAVVLAAAAVFLAGACQDEPTPPIQIEGRTLTVENLTGEAWRDMEIWLNDHYRVTKSRVPPGERFSVPLDAFVAGFGQRFNPAKQVVQGIEVTATTTSGAPVRLTWGTGRRR